MTFSVQVFAVDGETIYGISTKTASTALNFLKANDHEGATLSLSFTADDEDAYHALEALHNVQREADKEEGK